MSEWVKESPGEYVNGDYRIVRTGINPAYPWEVFLRKTVIELTRTLGEAKLAVDTDHVGRLTRETAPFAADEYARGYVCVAPNRKCSPHITVNSDGVWFKTSAGSMWQSAHRGCIEGGRNLQDGRDGMAGLE